MRRITSLALVFAFLAVPVLAADLGKYTDWNESPAGYFMTKAEREQWSALTSEAAAAKFVEEFLAKRGPDFAAEVKKRAEQADKYLTIGKLPASKTLRGRLIVLFGPPSGINVSDRTDTSTKRDNPVTAGALSNIGSTGGGGKGDGDGTNLGSGVSTANLVRTYSITFSGPEIAQTFDVKDLTFVVEADAATGKDRFAGRTKDKEGQELMEKQARASIKK
jgi:GWxTD domain-containing protein